MTPSGRQGGRRLGWLVLPLALLWGGLTLTQWRFFKLAGARSFIDTLGIFALVNVNILLLLLLLFLLLRSLAKLLVERRRGILGARLKTRLALAFVATTAIPTTVLFFTSAGFLAQSIDGWFSTRVDEALGTAMEVARSYFDNEEKRIVGGGRVLGQLVERSRAERDEWIDEARLRVEADRLGLVAAEVMAPGAPRVRAFLAPTGVEDYPWEPGLLGEAVAEVIRKNKESVRSVRYAENEYLRAIVPLHAADGRAVGAVMVDRLLPAWTLNRLDEIKSGYEEYRQTQLYRTPLKASYIFPLLLVSLLILFAVTWFGFRLAREITEPIGALADATQRVAGGDLDFQIEVTTVDEVGTLVDSFNLMTRDLKRSKEEVEKAQETLRHANVELDARRIYMEAVLGRITAGVVGISPKGMVAALNSAAAEMLALPPGSEGRSYEALFPSELADVMRVVLTDRRAAKHVAQRQVILSVGGMRRTVMVHVTRLRDDRSEELGAVAVLNDLTDLVKAERSQAWREVARRIAHEIKNPLTPIQLSAQRLRRRYGELLESAEGEVLDEATRTIVAQVEGLKFMVNEFSRFAKMPEAHPAPTDMNALVTEVVGLYRPAHAEIRFDLRLDETMPIVEADAAQIKRALVNLLDNAVSALEGMELASIDVFTHHDPVEQVVRLVVADNGPGLTAEVRERLFEPYFSTKKAGTGLGLAIVKSIMDDHRGYVRALDNRPQGTRFVLEFPLQGAVA